MWQQAVYDTKYCQLAYQLTINHVPLCEHSWRTYIQKPVLNNWRHFCTFQYTVTHLESPQFIFLVPHKYKLKTFYEHSAMRNLSINIMFIYSTSHFICVNSHYFCFFSFSSIPFVELDVIIFVIPQVSIRI